MSSTEVSTTASGQGGELSPVLRRFADMVATLPQDDGNGAESIVDQILNAESFEELDSPWSTTDTDGLIGRVITIRDVKARRSDFAEGLGFYVIASGNDYQSGDPITFTTGSVSVVAQLVRAYVIGALPLVCSLVKADRPTKDGYYPQHLAIVTPDKGGK